MPLYIADTPELRNEIVNFYACIRYLDTHFGRLASAIDRLGHRDDTLVIFTTEDHSGHYLPVRSVRTNKYHYIYNFDLRHTK